MTLVTIILIVVFLFRIVLESIILSPAENNSVD